MDQNTIYLHFSEENDKKWGGRGTHTSRVNGVTVNSIIGVLILKVMVSLIVF